MTKYASKHANRSSRRRCAAKTKSGRKCRNWARPGSLYCKVHGAGSKSRSRSPPRETWDPYWNPVDEAM